MGFEMLEDAVSLHDCLWCQVGGCTQDGTCQSVVHEEDESLFSECYTTHTEKLHDLIYQAKQDDLVLPETTKAGHLLAQEAGASEVVDDNEITNRTASGDEE